MTGRRGLRDRRATDPVGREILGRATTRRFDLVVGADGAGSAIRAAMERQVTAFTVQHKSLPNYLTMIELDRLTDQLDDTYLQALATRPFCIAGAIAGDDDSPDPRWLGRNVIGQAKSSTTSWSQVRADAQRLGPLWW